MKDQYITIKDTQIPIVIKSYKTARSVKIFFKNDKITITKPTRLANKNLVKIIEQNQDFIYNTYLKGLKTSSSLKQHWQTGDRILYKGEEFEILREMKQSNRVHIQIQEPEKQIKITLPNNLKEENIKKSIDTSIKKLFKKNTETFVDERLPYWSQITGITYNHFAIRDATTRFGSCVSKTKVIRFTSRLIMLPQGIIDAVIVHELCHIIHANHSKDFYDLVKKYIPNYKELDKWLKKNNKVILF